MGQRRDDPEQRRERVTALRSQGMSYREIGRTVGISHEQARKIARDAGLTALTLAPHGLSERGGAYWTHATETFEFDQHEQELLVQLCRLLDRADQLADDVAEHGVTVLNAKGERRPNPAVVEERQVSLAIGRLVSQLEIPAEDEPAGAKKNPDKVRAANARWSRDAQHRSRLYGVPDGA